MSKVLQIAFNKLLNFAFKNIDTMIKQLWWKILGVALILYSIIFGFSGEVPELPIIYESIRNLYFHVPMWMVMMLLFLASFINSLIFLSKQDFKWHINAGAFAKVGLIFGAFGMATGMEWARFTWGQFWSNDPKQTGAALTMLIYFAYLVLRSSIKDPKKSGTISAVYNIFGFVMMFPLIYIMPSMSESLHPGSGGNPGFNLYASEGNMRAIFYPAVIGWFLIGAWIATLNIRMDRIFHKLEA